MWLPKVTKLLQSKSGNLYLAVPMVCCGLCLGPLRFRLHCILLNERGLYVISASEVTIGLAVFFRLVLLPFLLTFFPVCWSLPHIFLDFGELETPRRTSQKRQGEQSSITVHFSSPLRFGIKQNHGCACLGGKECTRN